MFSTISSISSVITKGQNALVITACPDPTSSDLLWFKFNPNNGIDLNTGTIRNFASNTTLTGCLVNSPILNTPAVGQNQDFGSVQIGTGSPYKYIICPLQIPMANPRTYAYTINCWLKIPSAAFTSSHNVCLFSFPTSYGQYNNSFPYSIMKSGSNCYVSCLNNTQILYPSSKFYDNNWHMHTVSIGSGTDNNIKFYLDGVQLGTSPGSNITFQNYNSTNGNCFGFLSWGGTGIWTIPSLTYADIRIYRSRIPDDQIRGLYRDTQTNHP